MTILTQASVTQEAFVDALRQREDYLHEVIEPVVVHPTHLCVVLLAGEYAYKPTMYQNESSVQTFGRLSGLEFNFLCAVSSVIIDEPFPSETERDRFRDLADQL